MFRYVSIGYGRAQWLPNMQTDGFSLIGVGCGTAIDPVETYAIADQGFEFFGGRFNGR